MRVNPPVKLLHHLRPEAEVSFIPMENIGEYGGLTLDTTRPIGAIQGTYTEFQDGDVVFAKITPCFENGKGALAMGLTNGIALGTTELHVLRPLPGLERRFLFYLTMSSLYRRSGEAEMYGAGGQKRVPPEFAKDFHTPLPSIQEQLFIAAFLDSRTAKLDSLISKKSELIDRLKEQRSTVITSHVLRGLDPKSTLRDSSVDWIGRIPTHWTVKPARRLFREIDRRAVTGNAELLTVSHITGVTPRSEKSVTMFEAETSENNKLCEPGDLVINTMWAWMGALGVSRYRGMVSPAYNVYRPTNGGLTVRYLDYLCRVPPLVQELTRYSKGVWKSRLRLYPQEFFQISLPVPPAEEQLAIAERLDEQIQRLDKLVDLVEQVIDRLQEYRVALITAAVTGRIDVRGVA